MSPFQEAAGLVGDSRAGIHNGGHQLQYQPASDPALASFIFTSSFLTSPGTSPTSPTSPPLQPSQHFPPFTLFAPLLTNRIQRKCKFQSRNFDQLGRSQPPSSLLLAIVRKSRTVSLLPHMEYMQPVAEEYVLEA